MKLLRRILAGALLIVVLVVGVTAFNVWSVARQDHRDKVDAIVVLGASQFDGRPSTIFASRLDHAARLLKTGVAPRIITVGGSRPTDRYSEAGSGKSYLQAYGIDGAKVFAVEKGGDTLQSMKALAPFMRKHGWHSAVLVTDPWHEARSRKMARDQGIDATTSPSRTGPAVATRATQARYILRETAAYLYYEIFRRSADFGTRAT
ncbi:MAG: YdcF family protein [Mycobacteriales bacterium]